MEIPNGLFWHVHHEILIEYCYDRNKRVTHIRRHKSSHEQEVRLRLFKPVKGTLPQGVIEAWQAYDEALRAYNEALRAYDKASQQARDKAWQAYDKALQAYDKALQAYDKARHALDEALEKNMPAIEALHDTECPNCPWNGETIFPNAA